MENSGESAVRYARKYWGVLSNRELTAAVCPAILRLKSVIGKFVDPVVQQAHDHRQENRKLGEQEGITGIEADEEEHAQSFKQAQGGEISLE